MIRLVTYSDQNMTISRERCIKSALQHGVDSVHEWDREMIEATEFYQLNREILDQERGSGLWAWKSYIIYKALLDMTENDILIYSDAGVEFINDISAITNVMDEDLFLFGNNYNHVDWCKGDNIDAVVPYLRFDRLTEYQGLFYFEKERKQVQASVIFIRPTQKAKEFIKEWLMFCQMPNLIDDSPSKVPNYPTFQEHRHDQAILTCLQIKHGYKLHYWPSQYNNGAFKYDKIEQYKNDSYPIVFHHHRRRNIDW